jgi:hypothetical protein
VRNDKIIAVVFVLLLGRTMVAQMGLAIGHSDSASSANAAIDRMIRREKATTEALRKYHPVVENYFQLVRPDKELGDVPVSDRYSLGRVEFDGAYHERPYELQSKKKNWRQVLLAKLEKPIKRVGELFNFDYRARGPSGMIFPDARGLNRESYSFQFVRREFLGDVRCLVVDVTPRNKKEPGRFQGRIWIEDQDYNLVRFNGIYTHPGWLKPRFHMDSWRSNVQPELWMPAEVYSEESKLRVGLLRRAVRFQGETRFWGYDQKHAGRQEEFTDLVLEEKPGGVQDETGAGYDLSPLDSLRAWQREAEDNSLDRLERAGLLAPPGSVEEVLTTIVNNLEATNNLDIEPEVHCRVLMTSPLESLVIGHTIVVSRGLLDVVPDEATLAVVLAHELGHIGDSRFPLDTKYAFADRMLTPDEQTYASFNFRTSPAEEEAADAAALKFLQNSPYKEKLPHAGLFLRQLEQRSGTLKNLTRARLGNGLVEKRKVTRMTALMNSAPELKMRSVDQVAALPLGGRIRTQPWRGQAELMKTRPAHVLFASEKRPLEIDPAVRHLTRFPAPAKVQAVAAAGESSATAIPADLRQAGSALK